VGEGGVRTLSDVDEFILAIGCEEVRARNISSAATVLAFRSVGAVAGGAVADVICVDSIQTSTQLNLPVPFIGESLTVRLPMDSRRTSANFDCNSRILV